MDTAPSLHPLATARRGKPSTAERVVLVATVVFLDMVVIAWMLFTISWSKPWLPGSTDMSESARVDAAQVGAGIIAFWVLTLGFGRRWGLLTFQVLFLGAATLVFWLSDFP